MNRILILLFFLPTLAQSQALVTNDKNESGGSGINWVEGLNWEQIKAKAKAENKYIFVDCFATWCGPCKAMDKNIYTLDKVGEFFNDKFISVKVQMDTSKYDNALVKSWYGEAHSFRSKYQIFAFPTLLFFSPVGNLVHKVVSAYNNANDFIDLGKDAIDPKKQYYKLKDEFQQGTLDTSLMKTLASIAKMNNDTALARKVANIYINKLNKKDRHKKENIIFLNMYGDKTIAHELANNFINNLPKKEIFKKDNLPFIWTFTQHSKDRGFSIFYRKSEKVDKILERKGIARGHVEYIISQEEIQPVLMYSVKSDIEPDWARLGQVIKKKYNKNHSRSTIVAAKIRWYLYKKAWVKYTQNLAIQLDMSDINNLNGFYINNTSWAIFERSNNKNELNKAIYWMELLFKNKPDEAKDSYSVDTYANLLYKVGRTAEAISWEQRAVALDPRKESFKKRLEKMKNGNPTWPNVN